MTEGGNSTVVGKDKRTLAAIVRVRIYATSVIRHDTPMTVPLSQWQARGRHFTHNGHPVFYVDEGEGEPLLLIHGFPTASWDWAWLWADLTKRYRCIAPDMMGFGFSAKPYHYDYSILDQADLHERLLEFLGIRKVHVLAHDYGDTVAQELLARFNLRQAMAAAEPELLSLCLLNGGLFPETHRARLVQKLLNSPLGWLLSRLMNERRFARSFAAVFGTDTQPTAEELHDYWELVSHDRGTLIAHKLIRYINERRLYRERWVGALQQANIPMLLINGTEDPVSGRHMAEHYEALVPDPRVLCLENIGHYPQVEAPDAVLTGYTSFRDIT